jgi:hypothetical protein
MTLDRRQFLQLAALGGGAVFASSLPGCASMGMGKDSDEFYFVQLSDTHWGLQRPRGQSRRARNAAQGCRRGQRARAAARFHRLHGRPHAHDRQPVERRKRMAEFKEIAAQLNVKTVRFMPGEHDASLDNGKAFQEFFGATHYTFDHKGVHFIVLDNVSDPAARIGDEQLGWLAQDLAAQSKDARIVVFTHRPLFDLAPQWDWATRDGAKAVEMLMPFKNVTVFYGHIHQENHHMTGHIAHHSAKSLIFPLPAPMSQPKRDPLPWDPANPYRGLGFREVEAEDKGTRFGINELPVKA